MILYIASKINNVVKVVSVYFSSQEFDINSTTIKIFYSISSKQHSVFLDNSFEIAVAVCTGAYTGSLDWSASVAI